MRKLWLDTLVFDQDQLDSLVRTHGADKLCLGTDYPFDMSEPDPVGFHARLTTGQSENPRPQRGGASRIATDKMSAEPAPMFRMPASFAAAPGPRNLPEEQRHRRFEKTTTSLSLSARTNPALLEIT